MEKKDGKLKENVKKILRAKLIRKWQKWQTTDK
jgi:hypothetical protein